MKKSPFLALALLTALTFGSCKKKTTTPETSEGTEILKNLSFKLGGTLYNPMMQTTQHTSGKIFISTSTNPNESISFAITDTLTPGTYNFSPDGSGAFRMFYTPDNYVTAYTSHSGTGTVVSHDMAGNNIQATFNCMLVSNGAIPDTIYVTDGQINKSYPE
ncbi:hypothetical protein D3C87_232490 [compost metagenome]